MDAEKKLARQRAVERIAEALSKRNENDVMKSEGTVQAQGESDYGSGDKAPVVDPVPAPTPPKLPGKTKNGMTQEERDNVRRQVVDFLRGYNPRTGPIKPTSFYELNKRTIDRNNATLDESNLSPAMAESMGMKYEDLMSKSSDELNKAAEFFRRLAEENAKDKKNK